MGCFFGLLGIIDLFFFYWLLSPSKAASPTAVWAIVATQADADKARDRLQSFGVHEVRIFSGPADAKVLERFERSWWKTWGPAPFTEALDAGRCVVRVGGDADQLIHARVALQEVRAERIQTI